MWCIMIYTFFSESQMLEAGGSSPAPLKNYKGKHSLENQLLRTQYSGFVVTENKFRILQIASKQEWGRWLCGTHTILMMTLVLPKQPNSISI